MHPILIVDDEAAIADLIAMTLRGAGYVCETANDGLAAADMLEQNDYSLALLDIMLPEVDGYDLLDYAVALGVPVMFITAKGALQDRVRGLRLGADDYIVKPFEPEELLARVQSVLRRAGAECAAYDAWGVHLDPAQRRVTQNGGDVALTPREFDLLEALLRRKGRIWRREDLYAAVWGQAVDFDSRTLDPHINRVRKKLCWQWEIRTLYKVGYILEADKDETGG